MKLGIIVWLLIVFFFTSITVYSQRPPVKADFSETPSIGCDLPQTVSFTDLSENPDTWSWSFGDGSTSTLKNPNHTYTSAGRFDVRLFVQDTTNGDSDEITRTITIGGSIVEFKEADADFPYGCAPYLVNFIDESTTIASTIITDWLWDFGDGSTSEDQNPSHTYEKLGYHSITLTTTNSVGCINTITKTNFVQVVGSMVDFGTTSARQLDGPGAVTFQDQSFSGSPITSRLWNFGDGATTSTNPNPTHTYTTSGTFDVSLTISTLDGCPTTLKKSHYINTIPGAYDVSKAIFTGDHERFSVRFQESSPISLAFSADGTKMFVMGHAGRDINEYTLAIAWDVSTATYTGDAERFSVSSQESYPNSLAFSADGTKMFVMGNAGKDINEYSLSTAYDVSTATYAGDAERFSVAAQENVPISLTFSSDGTKMFVMGYDEQQDINEYTLSIAWDVSTATYAGDVQRFSVAAQVTDPTSLAFNAEGTKMFVLSFSGTGINEYNLTTSWDVSTATYAGNAERLSVVLSPTSLAFSADGTQLFVLSSAARNVNEYSLAAPVVTGAVANQAINDNETISPFATITVQDPNDDNVSAAITLDDNAKGLLTGTDLTGTGPYTLAYTDATSLQASLRALVFAPTENRVASGNTETTTFTLVTSDGTFSDTDSRTTVAASPVAPTIVWSSLASSPTNAFTITATFSEPVTGFAIGGLTVGNGTASDFAATSTSVYTATITPTADGAVTVDAAAGVAQDAGGVDNIAASQFSIAADVTVPTITISSPVADPANGAFTATFTFSENVTGFDVADINVGNGTAGSFAATSALIYTAEITPLTDGTVTIDVPANVAQDAATNGNTAAAQFSVEADFTAPTITVTSLVANPARGAFAATFTFSEDVTDFDAADITVGNGTAESFTSMSASVYTAEITPTTDGTVTVDVPANVAQDAATNGNTAAAQFSVEADLTAPDIIITSLVANPTNGAFTATFTFSEDVTGFDVADINVGNGIAGSFAATSASVYTAEITPTSDGTVTVDVAANIAQDAATNGNTVATQFSVEADFTAPTITVTSLVANPASGAFKATFTFSEDVTGFELMDITVSNGTAGNFAVISSSVYTAEITPTADGTITIDVAANAAEDAAINGNQAAARFSMLFDGTDPTVTITSSLSVSTKVNPIPVTITFNEEVTDFTVSDIAVGNGTVLDVSSSDNTVFTANIVPVTDGDITVDIAYATAQDFAGNSNTAATTFSIVYDSQVDQINCENITVQLDANGTATIAVGQIDNGSSDSFGIASRSIDITSFNCSDVGDNNVTLTITDNNGNVGSCVARVTVEDNITPTVITQDITVALDANGQASITPADIDNGSTDNCGIATRTLDVASFDTPTTETATVTLTVTDVNGNSAAATAIVTFSKVAQSIVFDPIADKKVGQDPVVLEATGGGSGLPVTFSIVTEPSSGVASLVNGAIIIEGTGSVVVTAMQAGNDIFQTAEEVSQSFAILSSELFLPTLFTPNNDQANDRFILRGGGSVANIEFQIFDREGNPVFNSQSTTELFQSGWDGTNEGKEQPQGAYVWVIKGTFQDGSPLLINGKVTGIIRLAR